MTETPTNPPKLPQLDEDSRALQFDEKAITLVEDLLKQLFSRVPELRSAIVIFDWKAKLNEVAKPMVWVKENGKSVQSMDLAELSGGAKHTLALLDKQFHALTQNAKAAWVIAERNRREASEANSQASQGSTGERGSVPLGGRGGEREGSGSDTAPNGQEEKEEEGREAQEGPGEGSDNTGSAQTIPDP